jgi:hypothetical protein
MSFRREFTYILLLAISMAGYSATPGGPPLLKSFFAHPSDKGLQDLKAACQAGTLQQDEDAYIALQKSSNLSDRRVIRALIFMHDRCNDAAPAEDSVELLGVHVLLSHPDSLLQALTQEQAPYDLIERLAAAKPNSFNCGKISGCTEARPALYENKLAAVQAVKPDESTTPVRQELILRIRNEIKRKYEE